MRWLFFVPLVLAGTTTPAGPVGAPLELAAAADADVADADVAEASGAGAEPGVGPGPTVHRKRVPFGSGGAGELEVAWRTARSKDGPYVSEVSLTVTKPVDGVEVLPPVVLPALEGGTKDNPLARVGVVVGWRKESACGGETASETYQLDGEGGWERL